MIVEASSSLLFRLYRCEVHVSIPHVAVVVGEHDGAERVFTESFDVVELALFFFCIPFIASHMCCQDKVTIEPMLYGRTTDNDATLVELTNGPYMFFAWSIDVV